MQDLVLKMRKDPWSGTEVLKMTVTGYLSVPDQVGTLAQVGTSYNLGWPNKELRVLSPFRNFSAHLGTL